MTGPIWRPLIMIMAAVLALGLAGGAKLFTEVEDASEANRQTLCSVGRLVADVPADPAPTESRQEAKRRFRHYRSFLADLGDIDCPQFSLEERQRALRRLGKGNGPSAKQTEARQPIVQGGDSSSGNSPPSPPGGGHDGPPPSPPKPGPPKPPGPKPPGPPEPDCLEPRPIGICIPRPELPIRP